MGSSGWIPGQQAEIFLLSVVEQIRQGSQRKTRVQKDALNVVSFFPAMGLHGRGMGVSPAEHHSIFQQDIAQHILC